jgi:hypothetical protein
MRVVLLRGEGQWSIQKGCVLHDIQKQERIVIGYDACKSVKFYIKLGRNKYCKSYPTRLILIVRDVFNTTGRTRFTTGLGSSKTGS